MKGRPGSKRGCRGAGGPPAPTCVKPSRWHKDGLPHLLLHHKQVPPRLGQPWIGLLLGGCCCSPVLLDSCCCPLLLRCCCCCCCCPLLLNCCRCRGPLLVCKKVPGRAAPMPVQQQVTELQSGWQ